MNIEQDANVTFHKCGSPLVDIVIVTSISNGARKNTTHSKKRKKPLNKGTNSDRKSKSSIYI